VAETLQERLHSLKIERTPPPERRSVVGVAVAIGVTAIVLAAGAVVAYRTLLGAPRVVDVVYARVASGAGADGGVALSGAGYLITGEKYIAIGVRVPGRIDRFEVEEGDRIEKGQVLARLDARDYRAQAGRTEAALRVARARRDLARSQLERVRRLRDEGITSKDELDQAESRYAVEEASVAQAENELAAAKANLDDTVLRSPVRGVVLAKLKGLGEIAVPGGFSGAGDLLRVADLSEIRAEVDVSEADLANVKLGAPAEVVPDAYSQRRYRARVVKLYPQVNRQKGTLKVEVRLEEPDALLLPDMSVRVSFLVPADAAGGKPVVRAPRAAIRGGAGGAYAWVVANGRLRRQPIELGATTAEESEVLRGLSGGEALAVGPEEAFREGMTVAAKGRGG
jgi:RND family efflux transporter MFP subunit